MLVELLLHLAREPAHVCVVDVERQLQGFLRELARDLVLLALDIARVLGGDFHLVRDFGGDRVRNRQPRSDVGKTDRRAPQQIE